MKPSLFDIYYSWYDFLFLFLQMEDQLLLIIKLIIYVYGFFERKTHILSKTFIVFIRSIITRK